MYNNRRSKKKSRKVTKTRYCSLNEIMSSIILNRIWVQCIDTEHMSRTPFILSSNCRYICTTVLFYDVVQFYFDFIAFIKNITERKLIAKKLIVNPFTLHWLCFFAFCSIELLLSRSRGTCPCTTIQFSFSQPHTFGSHLNDFIFRHISDIFLDWK